jgi:hypothetical protein
MFDQTKDANYASGGKHSQRVSAGLLAEALDHPLYSQSFDKRKMQRHSTTLPTNQILPFMENLGPEQP